MAGLHDKSDEGEKSLRGGDASDQLVPPVPLVVNLYADSATPTKRK